MPVTFSQIAAKTAKVRVEVEGDEDNPAMTITIVYYPNKFTEELLQEANTGAITDKEFFSELIKSWDIYEDEEQTVMFPVERINAFGIAFKQQIAQAIGEHIRPNLLMPQTTS